MYCQYCGEMIDESVINKCQACGQKLMLPSRGSHWRVLFLIAVPALIVALVYLSRQSVDDQTKVAQTNRNDLGGSVEILATPVTGDVVQTESKSADPANPSIPNQIVGSGSFQLPVSYSDIGPRLLAAGAIDYDRFVQLYERAGQALNQTQLAILTKGSDVSVVIDQDNAYFLLNFLWALGLTNQNPLLDEGPLKEYSEGDIGRFASTGGWTIGNRPATELYSSVSLVSLTQEQQTSLENVAYNVYRPCCNNHTAFADCNHGMAMLGLLELMAGQGASEDEMFEAAKYVNSFWYPQQSMETAVFFQKTMDLDYGDVDGRMAVGPEVFSGSGFQSVHEWLTSNGQLEQAPNSGGGCSV
ncbi:MAG TPA: hypothetical protein VFI27_06740 [candidate division Zixibacteria bacterium]|nr:hypothetical protein [candidate division Zixibacteria bacterium]